MPIGQHPVDCSCWGCGVRAKGVQAKLPRDTSKVLTPNQLRPMQKNSWAAGKAWTTNGAGERIPLLAANGRYQLGIKEASEKRHSIEGQLERLRHDPHVYKET